MKNDSMGGTCRNTAIDQINLSKLPKFKKLLFTFKKRCACIVIQKQKNSAPPCISHFKIPTPL